MVNLPFTPNHIILVNGCYPPSAALLNAGPEYRPNAQELSRLTYYASNHPGKIRKLANELEKRVRADSRKAQGRNMRARASLLVTLGIFKALATECRRDIMLLSTSLMSSLRVTLTTLPSDLEVSARAANVFIAWVGSADGTALTSDPELNKDYMAILQRFSDLCTTSASKDDEDRNRNRLIGLAAVSAVVSSQVLYHSTTQFMSQVSVLLPPLLALMAEFDLMVLEAEASELKPKASPSSPLASESRMRPPLDRRAQSIHVHIDGDKGPTSADVASECLRVCIALFGQANGYQAGLISKAVLDSLNSQNTWNNIGFCCWISQKAVEWTQYQYRYTVPMRLVDRLQAQQDESKPTVSQYALAAMIATVFTSPMPLINLSTSDVVSNLMTLVLHRVVIDANDALLPELVKCIAALGTHVYYADQVNDLAGEIISRLIGLEHAGVFGRGRNDPARTQAIRCLLAGLVGLIRAADHDVKSPEQEQSTGQSGQIPSSSRRRTRIAPDAWQDTLTLLCDADFAVRAEYAKALILYLRNELPEDGEYFDDDGVRHVRSLSAGPVVPPEALSNDTTARFLNAVHASLFVLATSACIGLVATSTVPSVEPSVTGDNDQSVNVIPPTPITEEPQSAISEVADVSFGLESAENEEGEDLLPAHMLPNRRASVNVPASRKISVAQRILDQTPQQAIGEPSRANASDFASIAEILTTIHQRVPCRALFTGVPMTYALDKATKTKTDTSDATHRSLALSHVVARTWSVIGKTWDCTELSSAAEKTLASTSDLLPSPAFEETFSCSFNIGVALPTAEAEITIPSHGLNHEAITRGLSTNATVHSASGFDEQAIRDRLDRMWTVERALKESVEQMYDVTRGDGIAPLLKISPTLTHIENVSVASLARSHRRVGVNELREALEGRNSMSNPALAHRPASLSTFDHSSVGGDHSPARPKRPPVGRGAEVRDVLNRLGIGKQNPENLLKASFPALQKQNSRSPTLVPPYKT